MANLQDLERWKRKKEIQNRESSNFYGIILPNIRHIKESKHQKNQEKLISITQWTMYPCHVLHQGD